MPVTFNDQNYMLGGTTYSLQWVNLNSDFYVIDLLINGYPQTYDSNIRWVKQIWMQIVLLNRV